MFPASSRGFIWYRLLMLVSHWERLSLLLNKSDYAMPAFLENQTDPDIENNDSS
jgi:hypothetical protein